MHTETSANSRTRGLRPFPKGRSGNPGGKPRQQTLVNRVVKQLKPIVSTGRYEQMVEQGRLLRPDDLWMALLTRYQMALESGDTPIRELTVIGRQVGEAAGILGMTRIHTTHDHYAHIPDELKPLIAEKLALLEYQQKQKECLLGQPPIPTLAGGGEDVSSPSTDTKTINSGDLK